MAGPPLPQSPRLATSRRLLAAIRQLCDCLLHAAPSRAAAVYHPASSPTPGAAPTSSRGHPARRGSSTSTRAPFTSPASSIRSPPLLRLQARRAGIPFPHIAAQWARGLLLEPRPGTAPAASPSPTATTTRLPRPSPRAAARNGTHQQRQRSAHRFLCTRGPIFSELWPDAVRRSGSSTSAGRPSGGAHRSLHLGASAPHGILPPSPLLHRWPVIRRWCSPKTARVGQNHDREPRRPDERASTSPAAGCPPRGRRTSFFPCFAGLVLKHHRSDLLAELLGMTTRRRKVVVRLSCELFLLGDGHESTWSVPTRVEAKTPRKGFSEELLVRGGNSLEGVSEELLMRGGSFSEAISCEAEGSRAKEPTLKKKPRGRKNSYDECSSHSGTSLFRPKNMVFLSVPKFT
jgi:hypothetical protein